MDGCQVKGCKAPAAVLAPTICEDVMLCIQHAPWLHLKAVPIQRSPSEGLRPVRST